NALFEAYKKNNDILEDILILIRIYETKNEALPQEIAIATNSQTRISQRDLMSNTEVQIKLEKSFSNLGYFYERKRFQHEEQKPNSRIDALKLGQAIVAFDLREPEKARTDSDKIFSSRYQEVFSKDHNVSYLLNIFLIIQLIDQRREEARKARKKGTGNDIDSFWSYGQFHILYLVKLLSEKNDISITDNKNRERLLNDAVEIMRSFILSKKTSSFYTLFRSAKTKEELYERALHKGQLPLPLEITQSG
ncbi:MAG: AIPR family protein, partial [Methylocystaceae bacterium]|nr:AIPR family protein [Methylocystaceae bacterium]